MRVWGVVAALALAACSAPRTIPAPLPVPAIDASGDISADELRRDLFAFADDSMRGRETGTPDADRAATYLTKRLERLGLEPAGDSLFLQRVPLQRESFARSSRIAVNENGHATILRIGTDVVPVVNLGPGVPPTRSRADGQVVFAGYVLRTKSSRRDDLANLDLEGKVVVVVNGAPAGTDSATRAIMESETAISERLALILPRRPAAVIIMLTGSGKTTFAEAAPQLEHSVTARSRTVDVPEVERPLPMILLADLRVGSSLLPAHWPSDDQPQVLPGRTFSAHVEQERVPINAFNVVAIVRGSDPTLSRTFVAYGAHYDHIGVVAPVAGDSIANGADDDGSGSVALLAIARSVQLSRPKRSTLFVWHVGEEKGLLGSAWFVQHPPVPIDSIVAQLNADMIGRNAASLLYLVGPGAAPNGQSRRLGVIVDSVNAAQPVPFVINREWDSATHPEHIYERSDHFNYARKGIPIAFFTTGMHVDYHQPGDAPSRIDYGKLARVARLMRDVGLAVANDARRPR
ncbi:M20/M25/M40 family metallo-hydrolase [soil metagenome]